MANGLCPHYGQDVTVTMIGSRTAVVRFDRKVNRNAINQDVLLALCAVARDLAEASSIDTVVLAGSERGFSAGIDLKDPRKWEDEGGGLALRREIAQRGARLCRLWEELPQLTIAALEGAVVGAGAALALACDVRVAARDAYLYLPESKVGLNMGWGAIPRMVTLIGPSRTKLAILLAEQIPCADVKADGLIDVLCESGQALAEAGDLARRMEVSPGVIVRMTKESVNACATLLNRIGSYMDADQALVCRDSEEGRVARARFLVRP